MDIIELNREQLNEIESLWKELNSLHGELSSNFKSHFESFTFSNRSAQLLKKEYLSIFVAYEKNERIGYCVATKSDDAGEIDSLYVQPAHQGKGIGHKLMQKALEWIDAQNCQKVNIYVSEGNESVMDFYKNYGFKRRFTVLQKA